VSRLLRCLAERRWPLVPRHQRQSVSSRQRAPLNRLEMRMIDATMKGQSVHQMAATLGINRKRVYNGLERIKVNFRLVSHSHFHHFMTDRPRLVACLPTSASYTARQPCPQRQARATGENHSYYLKEFRKLF
jgi:DNA-binding CsgD family transcriptional regulator